MHELIALKKEMEEKVLLRNNAILTGAATDYAGYKMLIGERAGLVLAIRQIEDSLAQHKEEV